MANDVKDFRARWSWIGSHKLKLIFINRYKVFVGWIQGFKADNPFKTVFQSKLFKNFNCMVLVSICKDLYTQKRKKNQKKVNLEYSEELKRKKQKQILTTLL